MQTSGLLAIGFVIGVCVAVLFGKRIAAKAVAETKAVANDASGAMNEAALRVRMSLSGMEKGIHAKLDGLKADASTVAQDAQKKL